MFCRSATNAVRTEYTRERFCYLQTGIFSCARHQVDHETSQLLDDCSTRL